MPLKQRRSPVHVELLERSERMLQRAKELIGNSEELQKISDDLLEEFRRRKAIRRVLRTKPEI